MKVICVGSASKDIFFPTNEGVILETPEDLTSQRKIAFEVGAKYHIEERFESLGGCSVNVGAGLARLGEEVSAYASIGDDQIGKWIGEKLAAEKIGMENVAIQSACKSDLSLILVDERNGERTIFSNQVSNKLLMVEKEKLSGFDWVFIGDLSGDWKTNSDLIFNAANEHQIKIAFNPRQKTIHDDVSKVIEGISKADAVFVNKDEAIEIVGGVSTADVESLNDETYLLVSLRKIGAKTVVLTDGSRGAWAYDGEIYAHAEALLRDAVDTTGAGDAFTSGFFAAHLKGKTLEESLAWGIINSSSSVLSYGGQEGLLTVEKITEQISQIKIEKLQI